VARPDKTHALKPSSGWAALRLVLCTGLAVLLGSTSAPAQVVGPAALTPRIEALLRTVPANTQIGLLVTNADDGVVWFEHHADRPLKPASVQKLLVSAAALERFGAQFAYQTRVYLHADSELWVVGAGDPGLGDERLTERRQARDSDVLAGWAAELRSRGVKALQKIILDDSIFDQQFRHPDWPVTQADRWYQAPVGGLNINDNCVDVRVALRGRRIEIQTRPALPAELISQALRIDRRTRATIRRAADSDVFELRGTIAGDTALDPVAARDPTLLFAYALRQALLADGIEVRGPVVRRQLSAAELQDGSLVVTHVTGLPDVLWRCNAFSQNLFAECLLKSLAAYAPDGQPTGTPGSWSAGQALLTATLAELGVNLTGATLRDGSGLSHSNLLTARQVVQVLRAMHRHPQAAVFQASLARPGEPGSMQRRYDDPLLRQRVRGKTGTLAGVRTLAGYLTRPDGTELAFAVLVNGPGADDLPLKLCRLLADELVTGTGSRFR